MVRDARLGRTRDREGFGTARRNVHSGEFFPRDAVEFSLRSLPDHLQIWERRTPTGKWDDLVRVDESRPKKNAVGAAHKHKAAGSGRG